MHILQSTLHHNFEKSLCIHVVLGNHILCTGIFQSSRYLLTYFDFEYSETSVFYLFLFVVKIFT